MKVSNKNNILEKVTLLFYIVISFTYGYLNSGLILNLGTFLLTFLLFLLSHDFRQSAKKNVISNFLLIILFLVLFVNIMYSQNHSYLLINLIKLIRCIMIAFTISNIYHEDNNVFNEFMYSKFYLFNIFWIVNIIVLFLQVTGTGLLIKDEWLLTNPMYEDHCSGLFGYSGTHCLAFFSVFILIYNFNYASKEKKTIKKSSIYLYNIMTMIFMLIMSTLNDNNSIFILYCIFPIYYFLVKNYSNKKGLRNIFKYILFIVFLLTFFYLLSKIPIVSSYINDKLFSLMSSIIHYEKSPGGSSERLAIFFDALKYNDGFKLGIGFGSWTLEEKSFLGFKHFGISSIGTFTTLCGIVFFSILLLLYASYAEKKHNNFIFLKILNIIIFIILSIYTVIFSNYFFVILTYLIFGTLNSCKEEKSL